MSDVKALVINATGEKKELGASDTLLIPLLSSNPIGNPPTGYVYVYGLTTDKLIYQKDETGVITVLTGASGGGSGDMVLASVQTVTGAKTFNAGKLITGANTANDASLDMTPTGSVLKTTPVAGDFEIDANGITYYTHNTSERGVLPATQFILSNATYTGVSQTALQKLFNSPTNGAFNVKGGTTYRFECEFDLSGMSATSGTFSFGFLGTATLNSIRYRSNAVKAALATASTNQMVTGVSASAQTLTAASTSTTGTAKISGILRISSGGLVVPAFGLSIAAAAVVQPNAFFKIYPIGTNTVISSGNIT